MLVCVEVSGLDSPAFVPGFDDFAVVGDPVEQSGGHFTGSKELRPFAEREVGRYEQRSPFIELGNQVEWELPAALGKREVPELIQHDQIHPCQALREFAAASGELLLFQFVDQVDDVEIAAALSLSDEFFSDRDRRVGFASAGPADQQDIAARTVVVCGQEAALVKGADPRFVDRGGAELEAVEVFVHREYCHPESVADAARGSFFDLRFKEIQQQAFRSVALLEAGRKSLIERARYYRMEQRWPDSLFWARRHPIDFAEIEITLDPEAYIGKSPKAPTKATLAPIEALLPPRAIRSLLRQLQTPTIAHAALMFLRYQMGPIGDQRILSGAQLMLSLGLIRLVDGDAA